jgi:hypothetical protein
MKLVRSLYCERKLSRALLNPSERENQCFGSIPVFIISGSGSETLEKLSSLGRHDILSTTMREMYARQKQTCDKRKELIFQSKIRYDCYPTNISAEGSTNSAGNMEKSVPVPIPRY